MVVNVWIVMMVFIWMIMIAKNVIQIVKHVIMQLPLVQVAMILIF
jgi:hypothetical protein